jgi:hypothetical protein
MNLPWAVDRVPAGPLQGSRAPWMIAAGALAVGLGAWLVGLVLGSLQSSVIALWCFVVCALALALVLPLELALVAPLFAGLAGWLVDMLPLVVLAGWGAVIVRWASSLWRERRLPRGGRWIWLPLGLAAWTALGALVITAADLRHFLLLWGIQVLSSATMLAVVDQLSSTERRLRLVAGLACFVTVMSLGAFLQWIGVPIQPLQHDDVSRRLEEAYGVDAFPNNVGMVNYVRAVESGAGVLRATLTRARERNPEMPPFAVFKPRFKTFPRELVVRFEGSARPVEDDLRRYGIALVYDNIGVAPGKTVPRMRSFPRNSLTYAGACAALFPLAFALAWSPVARRRWLGLAAVAACLFGAAFSLARGAWIAILAGVAFLLIGPVLTRARKLQIVAAYVVAALVVTVTFLVRYGEDPLHARAGAEGSVGARTVLYEETARSVGGIAFVVGFGTERPRGGTEVRRYVPRAGTHSTYLNYLFRTGVPGAVAIIALYVTAWLHARAAARDGSGEGAVLDRLAAASVVVLAAHAVILSLYVEPVYTLVISLLVGLAMAGATALPHPVMPWRRAPRPA